MIPIGMRQRTPIPLEDHACTLFLDQNGTTSLSRNVKGRLMRALIVLLLFLAYLGVTLPIEADAPKGGKAWMFIGTGTGAKSKGGIYRLEMDLDTGKISQPELAAETVNPTFLALHPGGKLLYAVSEVGNLGGQKSGGVKAFALDP